VVLTLAADVVRDGAVDNCEGRGVGGVEDCGCAVGSVSTITPGDDSVAEKATYFASKSSVIPKLWNTSGVKLALKRFTTGFAFTLPTNTKRSGS